MARRRAAAQLLHRPWAMRDAVDVARAIGGAQAQEINASRLHFRARSRGLTAADIEHARVKERSLLRSWAMRRTVHLFPTEDAGWLLPLYEPALEAWSRRRLEQLGVEPKATETALKLARRHLDHGPIGRAALAQELGTAGIELNTQTRMHMMLLATTSGLACLGPLLGGSDCLVLRSDWLGDVGPSTAAEPSPNWRGVT